MNGLIVRHFYFWRREIPAEHIAPDRTTDNQDLYEVRPGKPSRFIKPSSIVSRVPVVDEDFVQPGTTISPSADREAGA